MTDVLPDLPDIWVLRHGETEWNAAGRMQGRLDSPLTVTGLAQAEAQGRILARELPHDGVRVLSSPAPRALRTARLALDGRKVACDARLEEIDLGRWQGRTIDDLRAENAEVRAATDPHLWKFAAPGGETLGQMADRVQSLLLELEGPTVLVTHGVTSRLLRCIALGMAITDLAAVPGGQGIVHHIRNGRARLLRP